MIAIAIGVSPVFGTTDGAAAAVGPSDDWILRTGFWDDVGFWRDDKLWID